MKTRNLFKIISKNNFTLNRIILNLQCSKHAKSILLKNCFPFKQILPHLRNQAVFRRLIGNAREPQSSSRFSSSTLKNEAQSFREGFERECACAIRSYRRNNWAGRRNFHSLRSIKICVQRLAINRRMSH